MKAELDQARDDGYKIIFIDETMLTRKAVQKFEWSKKKENAVVDEKLLQDKTRALLMGISHEEGVEQCKIFDKSVNTDKFLHYLDRVREENGEMKVCLFMDNLSCHRTHRARERME